LNFKRHNMPTDRLVSLSNYLSRLSLSEIKYRTKRETSITKSKEFL